MKNLDYSKAIQISETAYWVGTYDEKDKFQCNPYLIVIDGKGILIDSGSILHFDELMTKVCSVISLKNITHIIAQHQDPDVCGNISYLADVLQATGNNSYKILTQYRTSLLIKHYGSNLAFEYTDDLPEGKLDLGDGNILQFIHTPYLHAPGAITTYSHKDKILFSSDLFGGVTDNWSLYAGDDYFNDITSFHKEYMPSKDILLYAMTKLGHLDLEMIAPQHGSLMNRKQAIEVIEKFKDFECGLFIDQEFKDELSEAQEKIKEQNETMSAELAMAASFQQTLLPSREMTFCDDNIDFAYFTRPCSQVSGDFIIFENISNVCDVIGMMVIDVMGHGVAAGLATIEVKTIFEEVKLMTESPAETLRLINEKALSLSANGIFLTATYAVFHCRDRKFTIASAGGTPFIHCNHMDETAEVVCLKGLPIGLFEGDEYIIEEKTFDIKEGDSFLLQTDGILECDNEKEESFDRLMTQERIVKHLQENKSSQEVIDGIIEDVTEFKGKDRDFEDDLTLIVFQKR